MTVATSLQEISLRIKYEGFAKLTTELSMARTFQDVALVLQANLKFIFNFTSFRILVFYESEQLELQITRKSTWAKVGPVTVFPAETEVLNRKITALLSEEQLAAIQQNVHPLFHPPENKYLCLYPLRVDEHQYMLIGAGNKENQPPSDPDYRFFRMVSEFLFNKFSQLIVTARLESIVEKRTHQLNTANRELSTLFYKASHDFSAPLKTLLGLVRLCRMQSDNPEEVSFLLGQINEVIDRTQGMLLKLKVISETESLIRGIEKIELSAFLQQLLDEHAAPEKNIRLEFSVAGKPHIVFNDDILTTLLNNLIENAIQFHRPSEDAFVRIKAEASSSSLRIVVEDNGQGIATEQLKSIFDLYTRGNENSKGNGVGLYLVRKIVTKLNGSVHVHSELHKGSRFELMIPLS